MTIKGKPEQYTVAEAAHFLELHPRTVYDLVAAEQIRFRRKGRKKGRIFFLECDLLDYLTESATRLNKKQKTA